MMYSTIGQAFAKTAASFPDRIFVTDGERQISFREAVDRIDRICGALLALGMQRHDRLALLLPNTPEWVFIALACARLGILLIPINTRSKAEEINYVLGRSRAKALVMVERFWDIDYRTLLATGTAALPCLKHRIPLDGEAPDLGVRAWTDHAPFAPEAITRAQMAVIPKDPALTIFTSGTTGFPKGAVHGHAVLRNAANMARMMHIEPGDVILGHMPFYHIAGLITALLPAVLKGCTLVTVAHWQADAVARLIADRRVNIFGGIPTHFIDLADAVVNGAPALTCLKSAWIGGAAISPEIARRAKTVLQLDSLMAAYGMSETSGCTTLSRFEDPVEVAVEGKGIPVGDFEVKVIAPASGMPCPVGEVGEIWVRGHIVMQGYLDDPEATTEIMTDDGWLKSGDLGQFDASGYLKITGRLKEMFIVGGSNVYPAEIERCLDMIPGVRQAIVVGVPDKRLGEVGFAFIQRMEHAATTKDDILFFARRHLADYKVPRHLAFVEGFPMTGTRKVQRHVLVADAFDLLSGSA